MKTLIFGLKPASKYFRIDLLIAANNNSDEATYFECLSFLKYNRTYYQNNEYHTEQTSLFKLIKNFKGSDLCIFALPLSSWKRALLMKPFIRSKSYTLDYYDDLYFGQETSYARLSHSIWSHITNFVSVLNPLLESRFKNVFALENASHITRNSSFGNSNMIGIIANVGLRFQFEMVEKILKNFPELTISLHGRISGHLKDKETIQNKIDHLTTYPNFHYGGEYSPSQLSQILDNFSIGLIPYQINTKTIYINPDKYYHYTNKGLFVLSGFIPALVGKPNISFFQSDDDLLQQLNNLDKFEFDSKMQPISWELRYHELKDYLRNKLGMKL